MPRTTERDETPDRGRHWSDWIGVVAYTTLAALLWRQSARLGILMLPAVVHELIIALSFLIRPRARGTLPGVLPRVVGYANSFIILVFFQIALRWHPDWLAPTRNPDVRLAGFYLWLVASVLGLWPIWYMRRSFSLEPEARHLITEGPYRLARHPIYTIYILLFGGMCLQNLTPAFAAVLLAWFALALARIHYEERVLEAAFPEYVEYRRRVGMFGPRLRRAPLPRAAGEGVID
jgi:hypothetical protein